jgi:osmotically-inducible protein OsmY
MIKKSDASEPLRERVETAIETNPFVPRRKLRFETEQGRVILHGEVSSYFQKQMAQEALRNLDGVEAIENHLVVSCP